jgi:23S rRNA pseudouridine1911/1915/1917 synthase
MQPKPAGYAPIELRIPPDCAGLRLDQALARLLPEWSRSRLQAWVTAGKICMDGLPATSRQKLWGGETIQIEPQPAPIDAAHTAEPIQLDIVHEDPWLIVINKPAGLVVHPGNGNWQGTLLNALLHHAGDLANVPRAGIVHRLDKDTSGLLVVAKTLAAQTSLVRQLQARSVTRNYLAIVTGNVVCDGSVNAPIGRHPVHRTKMAVIHSGKEAITHYRILEQFRSCTLLRCSLETGRTHQIRVHMHSIHHPIAGDPVYSSKPGYPRRTGENMMNSFPRQALHACQLSLAHPHDSRTMTWQAPLPDDMEQLLQVLRQA